MVIHGAMRPASFESAGEYCQGKVRNLFIFLTLSLITLTQAFESMSLCVILPTIGEDLGADLSETLGFGSSFLLGLTVAQPIGSELSFFAGRRPAMLLGLSIFITGTVMCGMAPDPPMLLAGRAVSGFGAGITEPVKALILYDLFNLRERSKWVSFLNVSWAVGSVAGPLLAGWFVQNDDITWRWVFWMNLPFLCLGFVGSSWLLRWDGQLRRRWALAKLVDWVGLVLFIGSGASVCYALTFGGSHFPWESAGAVVSLLLGIIGLICFGVYELRLAAKPLFPRTLLQSYSTTLQCINICIHGLLMYMNIFFLCLYFLGVKNLSPLMTGVWALPALLTVAPMALVVGIVVYRTGYYRYFLLGGWAITATSLGLLQLIDQDMPAAALITLGIVGGMGFGALIPGMTVAIQATVDRMDAGHAICLTLLMRPAGQCLGIAVGQAIFSKRLDAILIRDGFPIGLAQKVMTYIRHGLDPDMPGMVPETAAKISLLVDGIIEALRAIWTAGAALAGLSLLLTYLAKCPRLPDDRLRHGRTDVESDKQERGVDVEDTPPRVSENVSIVLLRETEERL